MSTSSPAAFTEDDVVFVEGLLTYRRQAVALAMAVRHRASDKEVAQMAAGVATFYPQEIERAAALLESWGRRPSAGGDPFITHSAEEGMVTTEEVSRWAQLAGRELDRRFVSALLANQRGMLRLATVRLETSSSGATMQLAATVVSATTAQIAGLQEMVRRLD